MPEPNDGCRCDASHASLREASLWSRPRGELVARPGRARTARSPSAHPGTIGWGLCHRREQVAATRQSSRVGCSFQFRSTARSRSRRPVSSRADLCIHDHICGRTAVRRDGPLGRVDTVADVDRWRLGSFRHERAPASRVRVIPHENGYAKPEGIEQVKRVHLVAPHLVLHSPA